MRKKYKIPEWIERNMHNELMHYYDNIKLLEELKEDIILSSSPPPDGQPKGNTYGNPNESKVIKIMSSTRIIYVEQRLKAINNILNVLCDADKELFGIIYKEKYNATRAYIDKGISRDIFYSFKKKMAYLLAIELGYIDPQ